MEGKKTLDLATQALVFAGGLNFGVAGILNLNIIDKILGSIPGLQKVVYILIGLAAVYMIIGAVKQE